MYFACAPTSMLASDTCSAQAGASAELKASAAERLGRAFDIGCARPLVKGRLHCGLTLRPARFRRLGET